MKKKYILLWVLIFIQNNAFSQSSEKITIAAAADLKFAMDEILAEFKKTDPESMVDVVYGSSGKAYTQIIQGAPYDMFFCADIDYPRELHRKGLSASDVKTYAWGKIVLWSATPDNLMLTESYLTDNSIHRIAIANPIHAPYGERAREALKSLGLWDVIKKKLVYGENVMQAAQFVTSGNAQIGIIALSVALNQELVKKGHFLEIPDTLFTPLEQGYIITRRAAEKKSVARLADFMEDSSARAILKKYGFILPNDN